MPDKVSVAMEADAQMATAYGQAEARGDGKSAAKIDGGVFIIPLLDPIDTRLGCPAPISPIMGFKEPSQVSGEGHPSMTVLDMDPNTAGGGPAHGHGGPHVEGDKPTPGVKGGTNPQPDSPLIKGKARVGKNGRFVGKESS